MYVYIYANLCGKYYIFQKCFPIVQSPESHVYQAPSSYSNMLGWLNDVFILYYMYIYYTVWRYGKSWVTIRVASSSRWDWKVLSAFVNSLFIFTIFFDRAVCGVGFSYRYSNKYISRTKTICKILYTLYKASWISSRVRSRSDRLIQLQSAKFGSM